MCIINKLYLSEDGIAYFVPFQKKLLESLDNKGILVLSFLYRFRSVWGNVICLSINQLINWCGYANGNKTRNMEIFKGILQSFVKLGWIELVDDISNGIDDIPDSITLKNMKINDQFQLIINHNDIPVYDTSPKIKGGFVKFTFKEMDKLRLSDTKFDIGNLACSYLATKQYIAEDSPDDSKSVIPNDYKCKIAYPKSETLMDITGIKSTDTMSKYMNELVRIGMLYDIKCGTITKMKNGGFVKFDTPTCYALKERYLEQAEGELKKYYQVDYIKPYNEKKDKPPVNHNPVRPKKDKDSILNSNDESEITKMNEYEIIKSMGLDKKDKNKMFDEELDELISSF